jgi:hypothetical protein
MPVVGRCRWCDGEEMRLVDSHIIPRSFYRKVRGDGKYALMVAANPELKNQQWQNGVHDNFLCLPCEKRFCAWDDHGYSVLSKKLDEHRLITDRLNGFPLGYALHNADNGLLKRFFLSVLWRANACKHPFFEKVKLGPYGERIKAALIDENDEKVREYKIIVISICEQKYPDIIYLPYTGKLSGVNVGNISLPNIKVIVNLDRRAWVQDLENVEMSQSRSPTMIRLPFSALPELKSLLQAIRVAKAKR